MRKFNTSEKLGFLSDVHANERLFKCAVDAAFKDFGVDRIIILGDSINKGQDSLEVLRETMKLVIARKAIFTMGNHELASIAARHEKLTIRRRAWAQIEEVQSKGVDIFQSADRDGVDVADIWKFLMGAPLFYRDEQRFAVHAGLIDGRIDRTVWHLEKYRKSMKRGCFRESPAIDSFALARQDAGALDAQDILIVTGHHSHTGPVLTSDNRRARLATTAGELNLLIHQLGENPELHKIS